MDPLKVINIYYKTGINHKQSNTFSLTAQTPKYNSQIFVAPYPRFGMFALTKKRK